MAAWRYKISLLVLKYIRTIYYINTNEILHVHHFTRGIERRDFHM